MTRQEAKGLSLTHYYTGKECPKGHNGLRFTSTGSCVECLKIIIKSKERKAYDIDYYNKNKERISQRGREYRVRTRKQRNEASKKWAAANPEKVKAIKQNYKAKRRKWESSGQSSKEIGEWAKEQKKVCYWCDVKCDHNYHIDHYKALSKGGKHCTSNMVISCPTCNVTKQAKDPYEWAQEVGRLF